MTRGAAEAGSAANNYQILAKLAVGGMAEIFLARGASVGGVERYVVLKRILRNRAADVQFVRMFLDEARLAAQLQHPNIAQVYDIGKLGDSYFFTMEYVHGETVRALLHRSHALRRPINLGSVLTIVAGAAAGLQHAHDRIGIDGRPLGIVHRDVSPSNLMISFEGSVKVVDFGVAKAADRMQETRSGTVKGKISYLSPEQCRGNPVDRRSDLFSLGIVMWEMLTTERLYKRASDFDNMSAIVSELPPPPSSRRPEIPPPIDAIVMRLLAKAPDQRYQTAADLIEDLEQHAMSTGSMLSSTSLGRYLRELFGQRPEPWIEMESDDVHRSEGVTVTSEPIPTDLVDAVVEAVDQQLAKVLDLSSASETSAPIEQLLVRAPLATTLPMPAILPPRAPAWSPSATIQLDQLPTTALAVQQPPAAASPAPLRRILVPTIVAGTIIGGVVAIITMGTSAPKLAAVTRDAEPAKLPDAIADTAPLAIADAAPQVVAQVVGDADVDEVELIVDAEAVVAVIPPPDAGAAPPDAAVRRAPDLAELVQRGRFDEVVASCSAGRMTTDRARLCTIAACKQRRESLAHRWFAGVRAGARAPLIAACREASIELEPPVATPIDAGTPHHRDAANACDTDPMACQH